MPSCLFLFYLDPFLAHIVEEGRGAWPIQVGLLPRWVVNQYCHLEYISFATPCSESSFHFISIDKFLGSTPPPPLCNSYTLVQATVSVGTVLIWYLILIRYQM